MSSLVQLDTFFDPEEAHIAKGFLAANGIDVLFSDSHALNVMPHYRIALGGYRILVPEHQRNEAQALLASVNEHSRQCGVKHEGIACPFCGGEYLQREKRLLAPLAIFWFFWTPFSWNSGKFRCCQCKLTFKQDQFGAYA